MAGVIRWGMPPDFYLIMAAVAVAYGARAWFRARFVRDEARRRRTAETVPLQRIGELQPGARVRVSGTVGRVIERTCQAMKQGSVEDPYDVAAVRSGDVACDSHSQPRAS